MSARKGPAVRFERVRRGRALKSPLIRRLNREKGFSCVSLRLILPALNKSQVGEGRVGGEGADPPPWCRPPDLIPVVGRPGAGACLLSGEISPPVLTFHMSVINTFLLNERSCITSSSLYYRVNLRVWRVLKREEEEEKEKHLLCCNLCL
ncbi:hypothetical protein C4D60_Mb10t00180 [Musa balbisiana]|uniref:Uncharacterized protein n=1 Tax=Musa balbisiana TaxID=52838 RepID=A0A4V4H4G2_MUSBA|nr:hypothetical protein C4D60_Mb10t00180 [Musa balbisiana]